MKGIDVDTVTFTDKGFEYDREWCVLNLDTQFPERSHEHKGMLLFDVKLTDEYLQLTHPNAKEPLRVTLERQYSESDIISFLTNGDKDGGEAYQVSKESSKWI